MPSLNMFQLLLEIQELRVRISVCCYRLFPFCLQIMQTSLTRSSINSRGELPKKSNHSSHSNSEETTAKEQAVL